MAKASDYQAKGVVKETLARDRPARRPATASGIDTKAGVSAEAPSTARGTGEGLRAYRERRDFGTSPEPKGRKGSATGARFVIQKHDGRRLHYDLRLELDGVLKSWATTRGPSLVPGEKRLAVHTEDHPLQHLAFEGAIPKGQYGGGTMIVWDRGRWTPEGAPRAAYVKGHSAFTLDGERLRGRWHLIRTKTARRQGAVAAPQVRRPFRARPRRPRHLEEHVTSVLSGRTNGDLAAAGEARSDHRARADVRARVAERPDPSRFAGVRKGILPPFEPCLATLAVAPPAGAGWVYEIKLDGYRLQARILGRRCSS